jgi:hypothetical protein
MEQAITLLATLAPEHQNYFAQMMINSDLQAPNLPPNTPHANLSMEHGVTMIMNWIMSQSLIASTLTMNVPDLIPSIAKTVEDSNQNENGKLKIKCSMMIP